MPLERVACIVYIRSDMFSGKKSEFLWTVAVGIALLGLYVSTLCPTVAPGDSGELAVAATRLEISHPPSYPLLTIAGHVFTDLFFFLRPIVALNLFSAVTATVASLFLLEIILLIVPATVPGRQLIASAVALLFGVSQTLWSVAASYEVYAPGIMLFCAGVYTLLEFEKTLNQRLFHLTCFLFGLMLTNHLSSVAFAPLLIMMTLYHRKLLKWSDYLFGGFFFFLPLTLYLYPHIRSAFDLVLDWYDAETLDGWKRLLFAEAYKRYLTAPELSDLVAYWRQFLNLAMREFGYLTIFVALPGAICQLLRRRTLFFALLLVFMANMALNFFYLIYDIAPYFLPTFMVAAIWIAEVLIYLQSRVRVTRIAIPALALLIALYATLSNYRVSDLSDMRAAEEYAHDLFARVPQGGLLFCGSDLSHFAAAYLRYSENYRPDCEVYGMLSSIPKLRRDLDPTREQGGTSTPTLVRQAVQFSPRSLVFAREPFQIENDFRKIIPTLYESDMVYYRDSITATLPSTEQLNWRKLPTNPDCNVAMLYAQYYVFHSERTEANGNPAFGTLLDTAVGLALGTDSPILCGSFALYLESREKYTQAKEIAERSLVLPALRKHQRVELMVLLGQIFVKVEDTWNAEKLFRQVLEIDPENDAAGFQLLGFRARELETRGQLKQALDAYLEIKKRWPDQMDVYYRLGLLYAGRGDMKAAEQMFDYCLKNNYRVEEIQRLRESETAH